MPDPGCAPDAPPNRFYAYGVVARLALVAASLELERGLPMSAAEEALEAELRG
jgi:glutamate--cysteine ligase